jgi:CHRD domain
MRKTRTALAGLAAVAVVGTATACKPVPITLPSGLPTVNASATAMPSASASSTGQGMGTGGGMQGGGGGTGSGDGASYVQAGTFSFQTVDDAADPTFNQLLGVNNDGIIAGYFGSGAAGHPNKGFRVAAGSRSFVNENVPGSAQTQVTAIDDRGITVGFFSTMNNADQTNDNIGFYARGGVIHRVAFPAQDRANPPVDQLLGVNDQDTAVGFYTDANGNNHGYEYDIDHRSYHPVKVSGATSTTATAIDRYGDVAGFFDGANGATEGFLLTGGGHLTTLAYPGASMTQALGVSNHREVVGFYQVGDGDNAQTHGFTWTAKGGFKQVDDPSGVGATTVNGVNDAGVLVGFYIDASGNTHGMLATPGHGTTTRHLSLQPMPAGTVTLNQNSDGTLAAALDVIGLTPGSAHTVEIDAPGQNMPVATFGTALTADGTGHAHATLMSTTAVSSLPHDSRLVIRLGQTSTDMSALAAEPIAHSGDLYLWRGGYRSNLTAVDVNADGSSAGQLSGRATVTYDAAAQTLTVTLDATGLTPGAHAAHIHTGSCQSQGGVLYMLMDFQADSRGDVSNQTRVVSGVTSMPAGGTWYLNVHLGDSNTILANGAPALPFRPLLCANG